MKHVSFKCILSALVAFCLSTGMRAENIQVGSTTRSMLTYIPANLGAKRPLIVSMHGMSQDATYQKNMAAWETIADTAKFAVVFPQGINNSWDISGTTDIDFVLTVIDTMVNRYNLDRNRVYLSGFSMGGMFTYHAMGKIADKIAAFAPISGYTLSGAAFTSSRPIPIIHTHGTADDVVAYSGVAAVMAGWAARNGCPSTAVVTKPYPLSKPNSIATKYYWGPGSNGVEVVLMELTGKGHWISNDVANGVHTSEEIWKFCKKYALDLRNPTVSITAPSTGTTFTSFGGSGTVDKVVLTASASDPDGTVASVAFYDGTTLLNSDSSAPYSFEWANVPAGTHTIKAVATDNEGRTAESSTVLSIYAPTTTFNLNGGFSTAGSLPAGWISYDGATLRTGPQSGLSSGSRILQFTGSPRDFDYGLYIRNTTGLVKQGYASYAGTGSNAQLTLGPGTYELSSLLANWNMTSFGDVSMLVENRNTGIALAGRTSKPTANIGNNTANAFSGSTRSSLWFTISETTPVTLRFQTADLTWGDAVLTDIKLTKQDGDPMAASNVLLASALFEANNALRTCSDALYAGAEYTNLGNLVNQYSTWSSTQASDYPTVAQTLRTATTALLDHKTTVDGTEQKIVVFSDRFSTHGGGVLPKGWRTFDSSTQRIGAQTGLGSGSRILQFSGATRAFDYGLYIRNISGTANMGFAKFAAANSDSILYLTPGKYTFKYSVCNWNMSAFGAITGRIATRNDSAVIVTNTVTPTVNIGNNPANSFSGATEVVLTFTLSSAGNYALEFLTSNAGWADAIVSNISLVKSVYTGIQVPMAEPAIRQIRYFSLNGVEMARPNKGLFIKRILYTDGSLKTEKIFIP